MAFTYSIIFRVIENPVWKCPIQKNIAMKIALFVIKGLGYED
jgi:hypothetical protein